MRCVILGHASEIHTRKWAEILSARFDVHVITFTRGELGVETHLLDVGPIRQGGGNAKYLRHVPRIRRLIRRLAPEIVNPHYLTSYGVIGALTTPRSTPLALSTHGTDVMVTPTRSRLHRWVGRWALRRADHVFSVADHMTEQLARIGGEQILEFFERLVAERRRRDV